MDYYPHSFREELRHEYDSILKFWIDKTVDTINDGFYGEVDREGNPVLNADKGVVLNTRILWTFSSAYNQTKKKAYLLTAQRAYHYIINHFLDNEFGGLFWRLNYEGKLADDRKQIYAQGFGIYGFSEYYMASGDSNSLELAIELFRLVEEHSYDDIHGGYLEALSRDWSPLADMRLSQKDANEPKSMNTHLHIFESYTNLYRVWPDAGLEGQLRKLIRIFLDKIIDKQTGHFQLFFDMDWSVKSSIVSYGHDIEGSWLLCEAAELLEDEDLRSEVNAKALLMTNITITEGLAPDHSLYYEKELSSNHLDADRHWWVQAELMVGLINAFHISGNTKYLNLMKEIWNYIKTHLIDKTHGEWFLRIGNDGKAVLTDPKAGFWKCPYHNSRALMEVLTRIEKTETSLITFQKNE